MPLDFLKPRAKPASLEEAFAFIVELWQAGGSLRERIAALEARRLRLNDRSRFPNGGSRGLPEGDGEAPGPAA